MRFRTDHRGRCAPAWVMLGVLATVAPMVCACGPDPARPSTAAAAEGAGDVTFSEGPGYVTPPTLTASGRARDGAVAIGGEAAPGAVVRLRSPAGEAFSATAAPDGRWSVQLGPADDPRMFALDADLGGRVVKGEGAVIVLPAPAEPVLLGRSAYGALPIGRSPGRLQIVAVDEDGGGGGAVSGWTRPRATVKLMLDGAPAGGAQADVEGRFSVLDLDPRRPFGPGAHLVRIESGGAAVQTPVTVASTPQIGPEVFRSAREPGAWRIAWRLPSGGVQTTLALDPPARPAS